MNSAHYIDIATGELPHRRGGDLPHHREDPGVRDEARRAPGGVGADAEGVPAVPFEHPDQCAQVQLLHRGPSAGRGVTRRGRRRLTMI